jgi:glucosylceramidase
MLLEYLLEFSCFYLRIRIFSGTDGSLNSVAFLTPENKIVLLVHNDDSEAREFDISMSGKIAKATLEGGSVATYVWV